MTCDKCGVEPPSLDVGDNSGLYDWPFDWCPFCIEREMNNPYMAKVDEYGGRSGGVIWKDDIGRIRK